MKRLDAVLNRPGKKTRAVIKRGPAPERKQRGRVDRSAMFPVPPPASESIKHGWSRSILELQIDGRAHERHGKALTNFKATLPPADSDMAAQVFKDPYLFDFLGTADPRREREVEQALVDHIQRFLLELGSGFAFVGRHGKSPPHTGGLFQGEIGWEGTPGVPSRAVDDFGMMPPRAPASP